MSLFTDEVQVEIFPSYHNNFEYPVKKETYHGFKEAKREVLKFLATNNHYSVATFYNSENEFLKEIGL